MTELRSTEIQGLGDSGARLRVYIANRPAFSLPRVATGVVPLTTGDIAAIGNACGNGWRKVFNVYAKLLYAMPEQWQFKHSDRWQAFRDTHLLQANSNTALIFDEPKSFDDYALNIITGRTYAQQMQSAEGLYWITPGFAINKRLNLVVCPYFDYRQLSNIKILYLIDLIQNELDAHKIAK